MDINNKGIVVLVGAGPGEASLLTIRGKEWIEKADVIIYDRLVSSEIMKLVREEQELIYVGKKENHHQIPQEEINEILVREGNAGKIVVRLKGGDPFVFGRGGEEVSALIYHGIPFEVIPGITSAIAAPAFAGIPVTHRDFCSSFHVITGHQKNETLDIDFENLVKMNGTLIFLMGLSSLENICQGLIQGGMSKEMPAALIENGTRTYQRKLVGTVASLCAQAKAQGFKSPSIIIVGKVCTLSEDLDWFTKSPFFGRKIIVTGPLHSNGQLEYKLRNLGADVHVLPMIEVVPLDVKEELIAAINHMSDMAYLVFTSKNGVNLFFEQLAIMKKDARIMWNTKVVAIGPSTSEALKNNGIVADFMPYNYNTQSLINEWIPQVQIDEKVLILRAEKATNEFTEHLQEKGLSYKEIKMYRTIFKPQPEVEKLTKEHILVCFTSASTVESFMQNKPDTSCVLGVCIGQKTGEAARRYGLQYVVSKQASIESMVEKIKEIVAC